MVRKRKLRAKKPSKPKPLLQQHNVPQVGLSIAVNIPGPPYGDAKTLDEAKAQFKAAWIAFKAKQDPAKLAKVYEEMNYANRPGRYRR